jgi:hypothetical protein
MKLRPAITYLIVYVESSTCALPYDAEPAADCTDTAMEDPVAQSSIDKDANAISDDEECWKVPSSQTNASARDNGACDVADETDQKPQGDKETWSRSPPEPPKLLLDIGDLWRALASSEVEEEATKYADLLTSEFKQYMFAPRSGGALERSAKKMLPSGAENAFVSHEQSVDSTDQTKQSSFGDRKSCLLENPASSPQHEASTGKEPEPDHVREESGDEEASPDRSFGEELLMALACEDKEQSKDVGLMTSDRIALVMSDFAAHLSDSPASSTFGQLAITHSLTMNLAQGFFFLLVEAIEKSNVPLADSARCILMFLAKHANPRELHIMIKVAIARISDEVYFTVCSLVLVDLLRIWTSVIPRISGKRALFVRDVVDMLDKAVFNVTRVPEIDREPSLHKHVDNGPYAEERAIFEFIRTMAENLQSEKQSQGNDRVLATRISPAPLPIADQSSIVPTGADCSATPKSAKQIAKEAAALIEDREKALHDYATEHGSILALVFKLSIVVMRRLPPAQKSGSQDGKPLRKASKRRTNVRAKFDSFLVGFRPVFESMGLDNPVDACQQCYQLLGLDPLSPDSVSVMQMSRPKPRRNRKSATFFNLNGMACYLMIMLSIREGNVDDHIGVRLDNTAFAFLNPHYALTLATPYIMTALSESSPVLRLMAVELLAAFLKMVPDGTVRSLVDVVGNVYESPFAENEPSFFGLASVLAKTVGQTDDVKHRGFAYEVLQGLLGKFSSGTSRFSVLGVLVLQVERAAMCAQLLTEMKDAMRDIDASESVGVVNEYRNRLADTYIPRYLLPRKELLAGINAAVATSNVGLYLAISDSNKAAASDLPIAEIDALRERMHLTRLYLAAGREAMRAVAAVAEHDRKSIPESTLAKQDTVEARSLYDVAGRTLNDCVASVCTLDLAIERLMKGLKCVGASRP